MALLDGKQALVVGVANKQSIAWGIARALHAQGAQLAFMCLETNVRRVRKLARQVDSEIIIACDARDEEQIAYGFEQLSDRFGAKLDILVHSIAFADYTDLDGEFIRITKSGWNLALEVSAYSLVAFARRARPMMKVAGGGSIMCLTFEGSTNVVPGYNIMGVAKAALEASVRYLAYDLGPEKIRVNAISPGPIPTPSSMMVKNFNAALNLTKERSPLLSNVTVEDVGGTAVYLASNLSCNVSGSVIKVDAGMNIMAAPTFARPKIKA